MNRTLLERAGGYAGVAGMVMAFYDRVLASPRLAPYFAGVDMRRLMDHQAEFIASLLGGPVRFSRNDLAEVHAHLGIADDVFDEMTHHLEITLAESSLTLDEVDSVMADVRALRSDIVSAA